MLKKKPEIPIQSVEHILSSVPDTAVRESATTVPEDVDGESE